MIPSKCFESWAGQTFLGYVYADDESSAIAKTNELHQLPSAWGVRKYTVTQLTKEKTNGI